MDFSLLVLLWPLGYFCQVYLIQVSFHNSLGDAPTNKNTNRELLNMAAMQLGLQTNEEHNTL